MIRLTLKDNSAYKKSDFVLIKNIEKKLADKTLGRLEKEGVFVFPGVLRGSRDLETRQKILESSDNNYRTGNVMGFVGLGEERLEITSRFSKDDDDDYFLRYLLSRSRYFSNIVALKTDTERVDTLEYMLLFMFPIYLKLAVNKGMFRAYARKSYNDANVGGVIAVARHVKENTPFVGKIAYDKREYSSDNSLVHLIRHTIEFIRKKSCGAAILSRAKDEVKLITEVTPDYAPNDRKKILIENTRDRVRHAYYCGYRDLQRLCVLILRRQKYRLALGERRIYGILFDGSWLWEEYIASLFDAQNESFFYHTDNRRRKGLQYLFDNREGVIFPDFISRDKNARIIADAKYKPIRNISSKDYFQLLAYMFRFDAKHGFYLYPKPDAAEDVKLRMIEGLRYYENSQRKREEKDEISVIKHGLKIPDNASDFNDFAEKIGKNELKFTEAVKKFFSPHRQTTARNQ